MIDDHTRSEPADGDMSSGHPRVSIAFDRKDFDRIHAYATATGKSFNAAVRHYVKIGIKNENPGT